MVGVGESMGEGYFSDPCPKVFFEELFPPSLFLLGKNP
jgi:hypothetical protein